MKRKPTEWEKILANHTSDKSIISKIYKESIQLNIKAQLKLGRGLELIVLKCLWCTPETNK